MDVPQKFAVLNVGVNAVSFQQTLDILFDWISRGEKRYLSLCNAYTAIAAYDAPDVARAVQNADLSVPDGMPLVWLAHAEGRANVERVYGPDLMLTMCEQGQKRGTRHYFYGATQSLLDELSARLKTQYPDMIIAGVYAPPFRALSEQEEGEIAAQINSAQPDVVWVSLGTPKQDLWIARNRPQLNASILIPIGAAFDFHSGRKPQAPAWMRRAGLEWLFRLLSEPRRLWRRYLINNPRFVWLLLLQRLGLRQFDAAPAGAAHKVNIGGVMVDSITLKQMLARVDETLAQNEKLSLYYANAHLINLVKDKPELKKTFDCASILFCDGQGLKLASMLLGDPLPERLTIPDWIDEFLDVSDQHNAPVFFLGAKPGVAAQAAKHAQENHPDLIIHTRDGYFDHFGDEGMRVIEQINATGAKVLLVGMGMPLQEKWLCWAAPHLKVNVTLCVGAVLDYLAGSVPRGPRWMTDAGFEWLWRLIVEPRRLWRRYLIGNPKFIWTVLRQKFGS